MQGLQDNSFTIVLFYQTVFLSLVPFEHFGMP